MHNNLTRRKILTLAPITSISLLGLISGCELNKTENIQYQINLLIENFNHCITDANLAKKLAALNTINHQLTLKISDLRKTHSLAIQYCISSLQSTNNINENNYSNNLTTLNIDESESLIKNELINQLKLSLEHTYKLTLVTQRQISGISASITSSIASILDFIMQ